MFSCRLPSHTRIDSCKPSTMNRFFYSSPEKIETKHPKEVSNNQEPRFRGELLSTGNQVIQSPPLTERIHQWRNLLIHQCDNIISELSTLKIATRNEIDSGKEYVIQNVFNDSRENDKLIIPSTIFSLGAFFCGRILTNKSNWGYRSITNRNPSFLGRVLTSLPARIILPLAMAGTIFDQLTPETARNIWHTFERDFLSEPFIQKSHLIWNRLYTQGIKQGSAKIGETIHNGLQNSMKSLRESITEINGDRKQ